MAKGKGFNDLEDRAQAATKGVKALGGAFDDLSRKGTISATSISQLSGALGQVHPLLGLAAAAVSLMVAESERLKQVELDATMEKFSVAAKTASRNFDLFVAGMTAGAGEAGAMREKLAELAKLNVLISDRQGMLNEKLAEFEDKVKAGSMTLAESSRATKFWSDKIGENIGKIQARKEALTAEIDALKGAKRENERYLSDYDRYHAILRAVTRIEGERAKFLREIESAARAARDAEQGNSFELELQQKILEDRNAAYRAGLEEQIRLQQRVAEIANSAIAGTAAGAFDTYADALDKTVSLNQLFEKSTDRTLRNVAASTIRNVGRQAAVEGAMEAARALASLAIRDYEGAGNHAAASAAFFGVAAAAGAAAGLVSVKGAPSGSNGGGRGRDGDAAAGNGGPVIHVTVVGSLDTESRKNLGRQLREELIEGGG